MVSPSGGSFLTSVDALLEALGLQRKVVASAASFLVIPGIVATSDLVALAPRRRLQTRLPPLDVVEVAWLSERFEVAMLWHERSHQHQGHRWIRDLVHNLTAH